MNLGRIVIYLKDGNITSNVCIETLLVFMYKTKHIIATYKKTGYTIRNPYLNVI